MRYLSDEAILSWLCISTRKVGGLRFVKVGRLCFSYSITKAYKPL